MTQLMTCRSQVVVLVLIVVVAAAAVEASAPNDYTFRIAPKTLAGSAGVFAENPAQGFRSALSEGRLRVTPLDGNWELGVRLVGIGRGDDLVPVDPAGAARYGFRTELRRGELIEWYINDEHGLEQGFTISSRPTGHEDGELVLEMALSGDLLALPDEDGRGLRLMRPGDSLAVLSFGALVAYDAEGRELPARMELVGDEGLLIRVVDSGAAYPVTVDPLLTTSAWSSVDTDNTRSAAWGDWDGDGDLDLAVGSYGDANRVYENSGGTLTSVWTSADMDNTLRVAWGDWDGDGDLDLAAGNDGGANRVYENTGAALASTWTSPEIDNSTSVAWGDWDGDGDLDLAVGNYNQANRVYENSGGALALAWTSNESEATRDVAWGDWDGDGDLDLVTANVDQGNRLYENSGGALASVWTSYESDTTWSVAWGDWDGDGDLDLAVGNDGQGNLVYENVSTDLSSGWSSSDGERTLSVTFGDWDGDGDLELAAGNFGSANRVYENSGGVLTPVWTSADTDNTYSVAWGDWDNDGDLDLAAANPNQMNRVYENTGGALASAWTSNESEATSDLAWGDWDGDGDLDLAVGNYSDFNQVYENSGGTLALAWASADTGLTTSVAWGDWDGDGDLDLAVGNSGQSNLVCENTGGALAPAWTSVDADNTRSVAWGDWDGDGDLDLAVGNSGQFNLVYENTGGALAPAWASVDADNTRSVAWGDWDGDGDLDLAVGNLGQANRVFENSAGTLAPVWMSMDTDNTFSVAWGDWDGDGDLDLAAGNSLQPIRVYESSGGTLASAWTSNADGTMSVAWGDWDGDGDLDLAAGNFGYANRVYENTGGTLAPAWTSVDADNTRSVAWGDWDGDGDLDLVAGNFDEPNRVYENGVMQRPGRLPETPVSPALPNRPGATDAAFFFSSPECLHSPIVVQYTLTDEQSDRARRIVPEYSILGSGAWQPATEGPGSEGTVDLEADADGWDHVFVWESLADGVTWSNNAVFRIAVPFQASTHVAGPNQRAAISSVSPPFRICDSIADVFVGIETANHVSTVTLRDSVIYAIGVANVGPNDAPGVRVTDTFSGDFSDVDWTCSGDYGGGVCGAASGTGDIDEIVDLPAGTFVSFMANAHGAQYGGGSNLTNTVSASASTVAHDPELSNNTATESLTWMLSDVAVTKDDGVTIVSHGQELTYTINVSNYGPNDAPGVYVIDFFPPALTGVSWNCTSDGGAFCGITSGSGDIFVPVDLPVGTHVTFVATATVSQAGSGGVTNSVLVSEGIDWPDPDLSNNTATDANLGWLTSDIFADGFESGNTSAWSIAVGLPMMATVLWYYDINCVMPGPSLGPFGPDECVQVPGESIYIKADCTSGIFTLYSDDMCLSPSGEGCSPDFCCSTPFSSVLSALVWICR